MEKETNFNIPKPGKAILEIEGVIATVKEGVLKKVDLRFANGIEITHPDGTSEFLEGVKKIVAKEIIDVYM